MKKQKPAILNISEVSSSDDESQAKPKIDKEELKKFIKDSDDESTQEITPKSSPQKPKAKRKKMLKKIVSPSIQPNKTISQKISQKNLIPASELRKLRKKATILGADSLDYSKRKKLQICG